MSEEDAIDLSLSKKKKSKKPLDLSALDADTEDAHKKAPAPINDAEIDPELAEISDLLTKKKKKKKQTFNLDELERTLPDTGASEDKENASSGAAGNAGQVDSTAADDKNLDDDLDFDLSKKKKKKKKINLDELNEQSTALADGDGGEDGIEFENSAGVGTADSAGGGVSADAKINTAMPWLDSDRDYTYDELINRVYGIIREKNPDSVGEKKRLVMKPPQVLRVGTKKTSFANFLEICKSLHRQPKHLQSFLLAELGTSGSVDANNTLIIKGRFQQKQLENVLRRYIKEYVACQTCRSADTILQKDTRLFFLQCESCGSRRSVQSIKSGFQALTGKRAAIRAKGS